VQIVGDVRCLPISVWTRSISRSSNPPFNGLGLDDQISSLELDARQGEFRGDVILFEDDRLFGRFTSIRTTINDATRLVSVSYVGDPINDRTSSVLLCSPRRCRESCGTCTASIPDRDNGRRLDCVSQTGL
jgi:hypothetical protein